MRIILNSSTHCDNDCPGCYYKCREEEGQPTGILPDILTDVYMPMAVGINNTTDTSNLLMAFEAIMHYKDLVLTMNVGMHPMDSWGALDRFHGILTSAEVVCISYGLGPISPVDIEFANYIRCIADRVIVSMVSPVTPPSYSIPDDVSMLVTELGATSIYALMRKGPPDKGWRMDTQVLDEYHEWIDILRKEVSTPVIIDECVMGVLEYGIGNCGGSWLEVGQGGAIRSCPYTSVPDGYITHAKEVTEYEAPQHCICKEEQ